MTAPRPVRIDYFRPPDRRTTYRQLLVHDDNRVKVTLALEMELADPLRLGGRTVLENGSSAVWFTFPGRWHDIGRFHRADGVLTGIYANVITPCRFHPGGVWSTTDLFLDIWVPAEERRLEWGKARLLDEAELDAAEKAGHVSGPLAMRARQEAAEVRDELAAGSWPPAAVMEWTLDRASTRAAGRTTGHAGAQADDQHDAKG